MCVFPLADCHAAGLWLSASCRLPSGAKSCQDRCPAVQVGPLPLSNETATVIQLRQDGDIPWVKRPFSGDFDTAWIQDVVLRVSPVYFSSSAAICCLKRCAQLSGPPGWMAALPGCYVSQLQEHKLGCFVLSQLACALALTDLTAWQPSEADAKQRELPLLCSKCHVLTVCGRCT